MVDNIQALPTFRPEGSSPCTLWGYAFIVLCNGVMGLATCYSAGGGGEFGAGSDDSLH